MREPAALRFGRYEVLFRIAAGGMAEVYAARMVGEGGFEKPVALKRMLPTLAEDERFVQMFLDEGRLAAHISSPHVVQTLDLGRAEDDSLYLVMELVVGVSLSALIRAVLKKRTMFPVPVAVDLLAQAASGLHDAHEARTMYGQPLEIVHRDVSPQNILVDVSGRVRITDFGVARALERATHTQSGEVKGKIGYFAPEQVRGKEIDRRTDVFALGIVAWETLAGRRLFSGDNPAQTLDMVMSMDIPRLDTLRSDVPPSLADAVAHALERDLSERTPTAGDFAEELRYALVAAGVRPSGSSAVGALVRENGGESLMKLEDGLRAQSPSALSRVRRSTGGAELASPVAPEPAAPIAIEIETVAAPQPAPAPIPQPHYLATASAETHFMPGRGPRGPSPVAWMIGAAATIMFLLAGGVGLYVLANRDVPEVRTIALPPVPTATTSPAAPTAPPVAAEAQPTEAATVEATSGEVTAPSPESESPSTGSVTTPHPRGGHGTRPGTRPATAAESTTTVAARTEEATSMATTPPVTSMSTEPPSEPAATTMMGGGMSTGLVGVSDFERELGLE
jgi:hypothetical protein